MKRFSSSVYMFFKKLICSEMKPLDNYSTFKTLGDREYLMRCLFFCGQYYGSMQYCWIIYLLVETCFDFVWKKIIFHWLEDRRYFFLVFVWQVLSMGISHLHSVILKSRKKSFILPKGPWKMCIFMKYWYLTSLLREKVEKKKRGKKFK